MATDLTQRQQDHVVPPEVIPNVEKLVTEDDTPVDNILAEKQQRLLTEALHSSWVRPENKPFVAMSNVGLFFTVPDPPLVPDALLSLDVVQPADVSVKDNRSYFMWQFGKPPDVVIEVVSNKEGGEDTTKLAGYHRLGISYYIIHDPLHCLSEETLRAYQRTGDGYSPMDHPVWLSGVELGLRLWEGVYEDLEATWLRWYGTDGQIVPSGRERAETEKRRADNEKLRADEEKRRADEEKRRADQLAERLRQLGEDPV